MPTYDIEALAVAIATDREWEWGGTTVYSLFTVDAATEEEAEAIAEEQLRRGDARWEDANGQSIPEGIAIVGPDIATIEEVC